MSVSYEEMESAADIAARKVGREMNSRWRSIRLSQEELKQEAWVGVLSCRSHFDPERGGFAPYAIRAGILKARRVAWKAVQDHALRELAVANLETPEPIDSKTFDEKLWRQQVRDKVRTLLRKTDIESGAIELLTRQSPAIDIAEARGVSPQKIFNASSMLKRRLAKSDSLKALWEARP